MNNHKDAKLLFQSEKSRSENKKYLLTIFTPTYNRKSTIVRTYESLLSVICPIYNGNKVTFEWIIVDDGSTDGTFELGKKWCEENRLAIKYYAQENQGKHVAMNFAIQQALGEFWLTIDSDDSILPNALDVYFKSWKDVGNKNEFCAVAARCMDEYGTIVGNSLKQPLLDISALDLRLRIGFVGELLEMYKLKILKQYEFPTYDPRMRFCPENIVWFEMSKRYKMRVVDIPVRVYYHDTQNSLINVRNESRSVANFYMWLYYLNNLSRYIVYSPITILKSYIGVSMEGFLIKKNVFEILNLCNSILKRTIVLLLMPIGYMLYKFK